MTDIPAAEASPTLPPELIRYFEVRRQERADAVSRALSTLRPYERRLVREAAVMGYVRGTMAGRVDANMGRDTQIPKDSAVLFEVVEACIAMDDLYPYLAEAADGRRRRITKSRRWPGE
ncbi:MULTISPECIES: hypothetical protein [unclassified Micromonospora]|uniref:hypothetical protein n=1 Tax=unclassified Micromonospora TaxID=2617518 RepID=UPI0033F7F8EB